MMTKIHEPFTSREAITKLSKGINMRANKNGRAVRVIGIVNVPKSLAEIRQASKISTVSRRSEMWG